MINEYNAKKFCCEDLSMIENYALAIADTTQTWICHHILGEQYSKQYLKENGFYLNRPACEFRFMKRADHQSLHCKGVPLSEATKRAISDAKKGVPTGPMSEATKQKISDAQKGVPKGPMSEATKQKLSKKILQYTKSGEFVREWASMTAIWQELGIAKSNICACCKGKLKSAGGYVWRYAV